MEKDKFIQLLTELKQLSDKFDVVLSAELDKASGTGQLIIYTNLQHKDFYVEDDDLGYQLFDSEVV